MTDVDIYADLNASFDLGERYEQLQQENYEFSKRIEALQKDIHKLCNALEEIKTIEANLKRNISELFNTAKSDIARKDRMIAELRSQLDDALKKCKRNVGFGRKADYRDFYHSNDESNAKRRLNLPSETDGNDLKKIKLEHVVENPKGLVPEEAESMKSGSEHSDQSGRRSKDRSTVSNRHKKNDGDKNIRDWQYKHRDKQFSTVECSQSRYKFHRSTKQDIRQIESKESYSHSSSKKQYTDKHKNDLRYKLNSPTKSSNRSKSIKLDERDKCSSSKLTLNTNVNIENCDAKPLDSFKNLDRNNIEKCETNLVDDNYTVKCEPELLDFFNNQNYNTDMCKTKPVENFVNNVGSIKVEDSKSTIATLNTSIFRNKTSPDRKGSSVPKQNEGFGTNQRRRRCVVRMVT